MDYLGNVDDGFWIISIHMEDRGVYNARNVCDNHKSKVGRMGNGYCKKGLKHKIHSIPVQYGDERENLGSVVNPIWLLTTTWMQPWVV